MRKRIRLLALLLAAMWLSGCAQEVVEVPELKEPVGVQSDMTAAYVGEIYDIEYYDAYVVPYVEQLWFEVDGKVDELFVYAGMDVKEGDILVKLDQTALAEQAEALRRDLEYADRTNAYSDALAELDIEMLELELKHLMSEGADQTQIDLKKNDIEQKRAALRTNQALRVPDLEAKRLQLAEIEIQLDKNVLRAPFSGRIAYGKQMARGTWIEAYKPVLYLADNTQLSLNGEYVSEGALNTADFLYARIGDKDYTIKNKPIDAAEYVSTVLAGGEITTNYELLEPDDLLEAGQYAAVHVVKNYIDDALLVPSGAVLRDVSGRYVYVDEDGSRVKRVVKVGKTTDSLVQILEGLEEGEVVYVKD